MTKKEKKAFQDFMNQYSRFEKEAEDAFKKLQTLNKRETGTAWCSAQTNYEDLLKAGMNYGHLYNRYVEAEAKRDMLTRYGQMMADLGLWN